MTKRELMPEIVGDAPQYITKIFKSEKYGDVTVRISSNRQFILADAPQTVRDKLADALEENNIFVRIDWQDLVVCDHDAARGEWTTDQYMEAAECWAEKVLDDDVYIEEWETHEGNIRSAIEFFTIGDLQRELLYGGTLMKYLLAFIQEENAERKAKEDADAKARESDADE